MADEKLQYTLTLSTVATGTGARQTATELEKVTAAKRSLEAQTSRFLTAAEAEAQKVQMLVQRAQELAAAKRRLVSEGANVNRWLADQSEKVRVNEIAYYDLNAEMRRTIPQTQSFTAGATQVGRSSANASQSLLLFSQGFEDAQYGIRGVLNNIPSLVLSLGASAGLAGAISLAAVSFSMLYTWLGKTEEKADEFQESISGVIEKTREIESDKWQTMGEAIDGAREASDALEKKFDATREAENKMALSAIENGEKVAETQRNIAEVLGLQLNAYDEIDRRAQAATAKREQEAKAAIAAEQERLAKIDAEIAKAELEVSKRAEMRDAAIKSLAETQAAWDKLLKTRQELEKLSTQTYVPDDPGRQLIGAIAPSTLPLSQDALAAKDQLNNPRFKADYDITQKRLAELEVIVKDLTDPNKSPLIQADNALNALRSERDDQARSLEITIESVQQTLEKDSGLARSETLLEFSKQFATDLNSALAEIQTSNEQGIEAKESIKAATADLKITAEEVPGVMADMRTLIGLLQTGLATSGQDVRELIALVKQWQNSTLANQEAIRELKGMMGQPR